MEQQRQVPPLRVDIVSDVVCPWCIIGYKQLMLALSSMPGEFDVAIHWHPFELNPQMPEGGQNLREHLAQKYNRSAEQSQIARTRLSAVGESLGFTFDYFDGMRMVNTFRAHQLLHWASEQGRQTELKLALFELFLHAGKMSVSPVFWSQWPAGRAWIVWRQVWSCLISAMWARSVLSSSIGWGRMCMLCRHFFSKSSTSFRVRRRPNLLCGC